MADLANHHSATTTKMLILGDSGAGKTGSLASLAHAGYNLRIIDLDNGIDILKNYLIDSKTPYDKEAHKRVKFKTITEKSVTLANVPGAARSATVWNRLISTLNHWKDEGGEDLGPVSSWTDRDVLVIDSLTFAGFAAMNFAAAMNAGSKTVDQRMIYFHAQNYIEYLCQFLYGEDIKCNVIITAHIQFVGDEVSILHGYPLSSVGRALGPKLGRYFNTILMIKSEGNLRRIYTQPISRVELKNSAPLRVKNYYDIQFGLMEYFKDVQSAPKTFD